MNRAINEARDGNDGHAPAMGPLQPISTRAYVVGVLAAWFVPPAFAIYVAARWRDVPVWLRAAAVALSCLYIPLTLSVALLGGHPVGHPVYIAAHWDMLLMVTSLSACWMAHRRMRASLLLKLGAAFLYLISLVVTTGMLLQYLRGLPPTR